MVVTKQTLQAGSIEYHASIEIALCSLLQRLSERDRGVCGGGAAGPDVYTALRETYQTRRRTQCTDFSGARQMCTA